MSHNGDRTAAFLNRFAQSRAVQSPLSNSELLPPANTFYASDVMHSRRSPQQQGRHGRSARGAGNGSPRAKSSNQTGHMRDRLVEAQVRSLMEHSNRRNSANTKGRLRYGHIKRSSHFDHNPGYTPDGVPDVDNTVTEDHSSDYWAMHLELQNATQENHKLTAQVSEEIPALRAQIVENETKAAAAAQAMMAEHVTKIREMEAAIALEIKRKEELALSLEEARAEHRQTLENAMMVKTTMENKYATLMETARRQQKRAEDTQASGERLHELAQTALEQAAIQAQTSEYEIEAMRESLRLAQGYQLHTVLMRVQAQAESRERRLTRMVSHLQAEKVALRRNLTEVSQERDQLFHEMQVSRNGGGSSLSTSPTLAAATAAPLQRQQQQHRTIEGSQFSTSRGRTIASSVSSGSPSLMALAASADPVSGVGQTAELEEQIKILAVKNSALTAQLQQEKSNTTAAQKELSQTREMARNMSKQMSAMSKTTHATPAVAAAPKLALSKTRGALLAGLRNGKLAKAVNAMDEAGGPEEALALQIKKKADDKALVLQTKPKSARSKTRGALLAGLRNGKLAKAVDAMDSAGGPPSPLPSIPSTLSSQKKKSIALVPVRSGTGGVMAVQVRNVSNKVAKAREKAIPIRGGDGEIMAVQLQKSVSHGVTLLDEGEFQSGEKVDPIMGQDGDVLAVCVSSRIEKDTMQENMMMSVRDADGNVMAVRVS